MRRARVPALLALGLSVLAALAPAPPARGATGGCANADAVPALHTLAPARRATLCLVNRARAVRGLPVVHTVAPLRSAAKRYATNMMHRNFFAHRTPGGQTVGQRIRRSGYLEGARRWSLGENLAWGRNGRGTPARIVRAWMRSAPHREVLLARGYTDVGIGVAFGAPVVIAADDTAATYAVQFGVRR